MNWRKRLTKLKIGDKVKILPQCSKSCFVGYKEFIGKIHTIESIDIDEYTRYKTKEQNIGIWHYEEELERV